MARAVVSRDGVQLRRGPGQRTVSSCRRGCSSRRPADAGLHRHGAASTRRAVRGRHPSAWVRRLARPAVAERVGFEPTRLSPNGFQDRRLQPLGHLSGRAEDSSVRWPNSWQERAGSAAALCSWRRDCPTPQACPPLRSHRPAARAARRWRLRRPDAGRTRSGPGRDTAGSPGPLARLARGPGRGRRRATARWQPLDGHLRRPRRRQGRQAGLGVDTLRDRLAHQDLRGRARAQAAGGGSPQPGAAPLHVAARLPARQAHHGAHASLASERHLRLLLAPAL